MISETLQQDPIVASLAGLAVAAKFEFGELTVEIDPAQIVEALRRVKHDLQFERLTSVTGVDRYPAEPRYEVVYHLQAIAAKKRLRLKARVSGAKPEIDSVTGIYRGAEWYERETFDLFGITFLNCGKTTRSRGRGTEHGHRHSYHHRAGRSAGFRGP